MDWTGKENGKCNGKQNRKWNGKQNGKWNGNGMKNRMEYRMKNGMENRMKTPTAFLKAVLLKGRLDRHPGWDQFCEEKIPWKGPFSPKESLSVVAYTRLLYCSVPPSAISVPLRKLSVFSLFSIPFSIPSSIPFSIPFYIPFSGPVCLLVVQTVSVPSRKLSVFLFHFPFGFQFHFPFRFPTMVKSISSILLFLLTTPVYQLQLDWL